jgi:hypothetical protein
MRTIDDETMQAARAEVIRELVDAYAADWREWCAFVRGTRGVNRRAPSEKSNESATPRTNDR